MLRKSARNRFGSRDVVDIVKTMALLFAMW